MKATAVAFLLIATTCTTPAAAADAAIKVTTVMMPTRDGTRLQTNIYRAGESTKPLPVLLLKTAYDTKNFDAQARRVASRGFIAVTQDSSGRFGSGGEFNLYWGEPPDGFDTVMWIKEQSWCDGHVGMWGHSYMGSVQWLTASTGASVDALAPSASVAYFYDNIYRGGAYILALGRAGFGANVYGPPPSAGSSPEWSKWYLTLPLMNLDDVVGHEAPLQMSMIKHTTPNGFWRGTDARNFEDMDFPAQHIVGYYDFMCPGAVSAWHGMRTRSASKHSRNNQQLILGPWDHATGSTRAGDVDFGKAANLDMLAENLVWYDRWFKQIHRDKPYPRVRYFVMGDNTWREASDWPPRQARPTRFFLDSGGQANTRHGNGQLKRSAPNTKQPADKFVADPANPVPNAPAHGRKYVDGFGPYDQQTAQDRKDVLVYRMPPHSKPLTFAGRLTAELFVSANTPDADFVVTVVDVHPDGFCHPLATGIQRASARESLADRKSLRPDKTYRLTIDIGHCAATIRPGHQLCVQIQASHFPVYARNTNTGEGPFSAKTLVATQRVYHDVERASHVLLPILDRR